MPTYPREIVAEVLAATDIVGVIGATLELKTAGAGRLKGLCPFHTEKTPSFTVDRNRQMYHCFGCGKGGDAIRYLMEHDGMAFVEAIRALADRAGIRLPALRESDDKSEALRKQLLEFGTFAARFFRETLDEPMKGSLGRKYIQARKLNDATVRKFGLGYVPEGWDLLRNAARQKGFKDDVLEASGLFRRGDRGDWYDFFRNRVTFPIKDIAGNIVAFGGRTLGDDPAKYVNSPETPVYKKSRVLYGLHEARDGLRRAKHALLVEGYFDLLRCFDAGFDIAVASCGTALTQEQAALLHRYVQDVVIVYDGDPAGINAALKATGILIAAGLGVRALALPGNQDPDDFIRDNGPEPFREMIEKADDFIGFYVRMNAAKTASIEGRTAVAQELFGILQHIDDLLRRDEYLKRLADLLRLNPYTCSREFDRFQRDAVKRAGRAAQAATTPKVEILRRTSKDDSDFVAALLGYPALLDAAKAACAKTPLPEGPLSEILGVLFTGSETPMQDLESDEARQLLSAAGTVDAPPFETAEENVTKRLNRIRRDALDAEAALIMREIVEAERIQDMALLAKLYQRKVQLKRETERIGAT